MIVLPFMPAYGEPDSKPTVFESLPYGAGSQSRQANRAVMLPARGSSEGDSSETSRSTSIPLPTSHVHRTQSELQLDQDQEVADQRDTTMFYRLVNGIRDRHHGAYEEQLSQSERSLRSIIHTRLADAHHAAQANQPSSSLGTHQFHFQHQQGMAMAYGVNHISPIVEAMPHAADEWSITGFNEQQPLPVGLVHPASYLIHHQHLPEDVAPADTDSEIFDLDP